MNDLDKIKELLFGNEKKALDSLVRRLEAPESRTADIADVLPDAVTRSYNTDERLGKALSQPLESTLSEAIRREPKKFADALFPVMGPAIRKAISEAIKSTLQMINTAMDAKSPATRYKAWRAGVPMAEYVFRQSVVYRVDELYLVDPESGRLVSYLYHPDVSVKDEDAVSAMLTAIQDFVRDSFAHGSGGGLDSVVIDEYTVLISQGPHAMLACVVRGVPPNQFKSEIAAVNERIHLRHSQALLDFDGVAGSISGLDTELEELLKVQRAEQPDDKPLMSLPVKVFLVALIAGLLYLLVNSYLVNSKINNFANLMRETPGLLATQLKRDGHRSVLVEGLRDPLAPDPTELATQVGIKPDNLTSSFQPFQSLETTMIQQRAVSLLNPPNTVELTIESGTLVATGAASSEFRERLLSLGQMLGGVNVVDVSALKQDDGALLLALKQLLSPPDSVEISVTQGVAVISGMAPQTWHETLNSALSKVPGLVAINKRSLKSAERVRLVTLVATLNGKSLLFGTGDRLLPNQQGALAKTAANLREYETLAPLLGLVPKVNIVGQVDGTGAPELNESLMARRASIFRSALVDLGVSAQILTVSTGSIPGESSTDLNKRRAVISMMTTSVQE